MSSNYEDWTDWAGDHHEEVEAERRAKLVEWYNLAVTEECEHAEVSASGYCENCAIEVAGWEPDDAQLLTQTGTKVPAA